MGIRCAPPALGVRLPTGAGMSLADLCEEGYPRDVLEHIVVHRRPYRASYKCLRRQATDFPVVNVAAAYWGDE